MAQQSAVASPKLEESGRLVPLQLVDGVNTTADTHLTLPVALGAEVAVAESFGLSVGHWGAVLLRFVACLG